MSEATPKTIRTFSRPAQPLRREAVEPILFLADQLFEDDPEFLPRDLRMVDSVAEIIGMGNFRHQPWYRELTETGAVQRIRSSIERRAAMVLLSLVYKSNPNRSARQRAHLSRLRLELRAEPIRVPKNLEQHRRLAVDYLRQD